MTLKYHQATYDLLTQKFIDPRPAAKAYAEYQRAIYHEVREPLAWTTLDLYQHPIQESKSNVEQLNALEEKYHTKLPAAVREWFSLDITPEIMCASNAEAGFVPIPDFKPFSDLGDAVSPNAVRTDFWYFLFCEYIDQAGDRIAFKIDGSDDPPVYAKYGGDFVELASSFSEFIYHYFWDWLGHYTFPHGFRISAHPALPSSNLPLRFHIPMQRLSQQFSPLHDLYRLHFYNEHVRLWPYVTERAENIDDDKTNFGGGEFRADSVEALNDLIRRLWPDDAPAFRMETWEWSDQDGFALIQCLRETKLKQVMLAANGWIKASDLAFELGALVPHLNTLMSEHIKALIETGEIEAHPDNRDDDKGNRQFRAKR